MTECQAEEPRYPHEWDIGFFGQLVSTSLYDHNGANCNTFVVAGR